MCGGGGPGGDTTGAGTGVCRKGACSC
jgi:hypothetical protein